MKWVLTNSVTKLFFLILLSIQILSGINLKNNHTIHSSTKKSLSNNFSNRIINLTYYLDNRAFNTFNVLTASKLPFGLNIFGFIDLHSSQNQIKDRFDLTRYFIEYRLRYTIDGNHMFGIKNLGIDLEYNDFTGTNNHLFRLGITNKQFIYLFGNKSWMQIRYFPFESDKSGDQISFSFLLKLSSNIFINGFIDYNINKKKQNKIVTEPQLNIRLNEYLIINIEYRYNGYEEKNPDLIGSGIALGLRLDL